MGSIQETRRSVGVKYVVACDGTWENSDTGVEQNAFAPPTAQIPSNVPRILRAIAHKDASGIPQIVFYQRGVGTDTGLEDKFIGGLTGNDLSEHVQEAYGFLANNFDPETQADLEDWTKSLDEIVLLGFSRGAFTARAIASLISDIGLLTRIGMESFWGIFGDWMKQDTHEFCPWFESEFGEKIKFTDVKYRNTLMERDLTRWGMPIRAVGVWDTVGALGIPLPWKEKNVKEFSFVNTKVARHVLNAFHALALDEHRNLFTPTLWEQPDSLIATPKGFDHPHRLLTLKQTWFPGVHANIGGSYEDAGISNITLAWMISQLEDTDGGILTFNPNILNWVQDQDMEKNHRPWGLGRIYDSAPKTTMLGLIEGIYPITRTPGRYYEINLDDGKQDKVSEKRLKNTNEAIHTSVRIRMDNHGLNTEEDPDSSLLGKVASAVKHFLSKDNVPVYRSAALSNYRLIQSNTVKSEKSHSKQWGGEVVWKAKDGLESLPEDMLGRTEIRMLERSVNRARTFVG